MKIKNLFMGMAAVATFAACSNDNDFAINNEQENNAPVEIKLSSSAVANVVTRSSVESDENGLFEADGIGVFCLAKAKQGVNVNENDIDWNEGNEFCVWLENEAMNAKFNADTTQTDLQFVDQTSLKYYPIANWYSYDFYGYYPYVETAQVEKTATGRKVSYEIDGLKDIIWGKATSDEQYAYSAKYFRVPENVDKTPNMQFQHKLMRITFSYIAGEDYEGSNTYKNAQEMGVESISLVNVPTTCELIIADKDNIEEGKLVADWDNCDTLYLTDPEDAPLGENYWVTFNEEGTPVEQIAGQGFLVPVPEYEVGEDPNEKFVYRVGITLKHKNGQTFYSERFLELRANKQFEAGKSYNVKMTINGPKVIQLTSTLNAWEIDNETIGGIEL